MFTQTVINFLIGFGEISATSCFRKNAYKEKRERENYNRFIVIYQTSFYIKEELGACHNLCDNVNAQNVVAHRVGVIFKILSNCIFYYYITVIMC